MIVLLLAGLAEIAGILIFARISDRKGNRPVAFWSAAVLFLLAYPFFWLVNTEVPVLIWLAMSVRTFWAGGVSWPVATYLAANSFISLVAVYLTAENYRVENYDELPGERG